MPVVTKHSIAEEHHTAFLSKREVLKLIPICPTTLWSWVRKSAFPAPRVIGSKTVWLASEVREWMKTRPLRNYKKPQTIGSKSSWWDSDWTPATGCSHQSPPLCKKKGG